MRKILIGAGLTCAAFVALSLAPELHRSIDSLSMLRPILGAACLLAVAAVSRKPLRVLLLAAGFLSLTFTLLSLPTVQQGGGFRIYSKNLRYDNADIDPIFHDITKAKVEVVMLQEVSAINKPLLKKLGPEFPYQHVCATKARSNIALASKYPFVTPPKCSKSRAFLITRIAPGGEDIWIASMHIPWPWPANTENSERETWAALAMLSGPMVLAGDFNSFPWSTRMSRVMTLTKTRPAGPLRLTLNHRKIPAILPIDYVLATGGGFVEKRPLFGSDHFGLVGQVSPFTAN